MKKETILKLSNGHSVTEKEYEDFIAEWEERGIIEQPPRYHQETKHLYRGNRPVSFL